MSYTIYGGRVVYNLQYDTDSDFLCSSGGMFFVQKNDIFLAVDCQNLKVTEGPESHVRDYDEIVKLYSCGVLPGTFLRLTKFHV